MSGRYLLDTNIVIAIFAQDATVSIGLANALEVFIPSVVIGELIFGAHKSARKEANLARIAELVASSLILPCDANTARFYGQIKNLLKQKGKPIPENDIWIAAVALENDLTLISRDNHFGEVEGLKLEAW